MDGPAGFQRSRSQRSPRVAATRCDPRPQAFSHKAYFYAQNLYIIKLIRED